MAGAESLPSFTPQKRPALREASALLCPSMSGRYPLPDSLQELHTQPQRRSQIRLLKYKPLLTCQKLLTFEYLKSAAYITLPYAEVTDEMWDETAVVSWRWHRRRPITLDASFSPMSHVQLSELKRILAKEEGIKFVWIDFACVPQKHTAHCMSEVMRSRIYFHKARRMIVVPSMVVLPNKNNIWPMLKGAIQAMERQRHGFGAHLPEDVTEVRSLLKEMLSVALLSKRDYFTRAWTLAERMARAPRGERLEHWIPLRLWISTVADLLWVASMGEDEDGEVEAFPWDMLDAEHGSAMLAVLQEVHTLCKAEDMRTYLSKGEGGIEDHLAKLFLHAFKAWQAPLPTQTLSKEWLRKYMQQ
eukprot:scaffold29194_cov48-Prasinocladus_malaysianus.AAC.1